MTFNWDSVLLNYKCTFNNKSGLEDKTESEFAKIGLKKETIDTIEEIVLKGP
ncbi:MAG: hypothetical protein QXO35_01805 [Candidatus Micrarchaeia archaeon]